ncbi:hypothetical protein [Halobacillus massiliensis]|uniref:hypothetical protein n=1 Tax=Halobacillus massiliensis TaxID=1926286 RepID=UPI0009E29689|nr:hypothetical protein [Halobacillus massiliensis]
MKKYLIIFGLTATLIGCSASTSANEEKPTQQELDEQLRKEAMAVDYVTVSGGEVEVGEKISISGAITAEETSEDKSSYVVTTEEEGGYGTYNVENIDPDANYETGEIVEVYGTFQGTDDAGTPIIESPVIDSVK